MQEDNLQNADEIISRLRSAFSFNTDKELAAFLGISGSTISSWKKRNSVGYDLIFTKCKDKLDFHWLVTGHKRLISSGRPQLVNEKNPEYSNTIQDEGDTIRYVPSVAYPQYIEKINDKDYLKQLPMVNIHDMLPPGSYRAFEVIGDPMSNMFMPSDRVMGRYVDNYDKIANFHPYIIVTEEDILIRKIVSRIEQNGTLELHYHNPVYLPYSPTIIPVQEIKELWKWVPPTLRMSLVNDTKEETIQLLETKIIELKDKNQKEKH